MAFLIGGANSAADTGFSVANSVRLGGDAYMHKTQVGGNRQIFTMSCWTKLTGLYGAEAGSLLSTDGTDDDSNFHFGVDHGGGSGGDTHSLFLHIYGADGFRTTPLLRDYFAWYHIVLAVDTTQSTSSNRMKLYVNNVQQTLSEQGDYPAQNDNFGVNEADTVIGVGTHPGAVSDYALNSYLAEYCLIDGLQLTPSSFAEANEDSPTIWQPKDVSGLTFGTNGFYLDFEDSANLGNDKNGGTDLTEVSLAATDQSTDTPTNNFATLNPLGNYVGNGVFSEGNLVMTTATNGHYGRGMSTIRPANGKWYAECKVLDVDRFQIGFMNGDETWNLQGGEDTNSVIVGYNADAYMAGSFADYFDGDLSDDDIIMLAMDLDNNLAFMGVNGTWANSATEGEIEAATATNSLTTHVSSTVPVNTGHVGMFIEDNSGTEKMSGSFNFGSPAYANSSDAADGNGYGAFEYAPPSGFFALCTKNLAQYG